VGVLFGISKALRPWVRGTPGPGSGGWGCSLGSRKRCGAVRARTRIRTGSAWGCSLGSRKRCGPTFAPPGGVGGACGGALWDLESAAAQLHVARRAVTLAVGVLFGISKALRPGAGAAVSGAGERGGALWDLESAAAGLSGDKGLSAVSPQARDLGAGLTTEEGANHMVTFHGIGSNDRHLLGVGLSEENLRLLREGKPILRPLDHLGEKFAGIDLLICWGKNEAPSWPKRSRNRTAWCRPNWQSSLARSIVPASPIS